MNRVLSLGNSAQRQRVGPSRRLLGLHVSSDCRTVAGALVQTTGQGLHAGVELLAADTNEVAPQVVQRYQNLRAGRLERPGDVGLLAAGLAEVQARLVEQLLAQGHLTAEEVTALGVHDSGLWHIVPGGRSGYVGLCDAAGLAETTGLCVIDAFPARDLACGGQGGPVTALPLWMILRDRQRTRALLDLGRTTRLTYLPPTKVGSAGVRSFDVGPGTLLLDELAGRFSGGRYTHDPGGRLAVQGRRIPDLIEHWLEDPYFRRPPPRWHPLGVRPDDELDQTVEMAVRAGWSIRDLLCTATHFIAESIQRALANHMPTKPAVEEVLIVGGGQQNGLLLRELSARLSGKVLTRYSERGTPDIVLEAWAVAVLGSLHVDQVPANPEAITGTNAPRVLGRLTPGSPAAWRRLLQVLTEQPHTKTAMRDAV
ncbi:MAG: hypothetical protein GTO53_12430 [Planctomycetales bacterium]|nr:hypothetical protein [Planctomycetales bacterium]NIM09909.1 hypothetical protein [Planctomycetales bacterium]NIN09348.1 hypothetical protein [Planctomycetales bacterium]NIN78458.1 hypothetical protein [Planctomycetales bacterium]NIO35648.1 hypothetical protein [Planctomycetales bacterium]